MASANGAVQGAIGSKADLRAQRGVDGFEAVLLSSRDTWRTDMAIRPLHDRVLIKRVEEEQKTKGGIIIPDTAKEKPAEGKVIAVGNGRVLEDGKVRPLDVKAGDRVLFGKYSGTEVKVDGEEHLILREDDILVVLEK
jgi:chaperonin GroES